MPIRLKQFNVKYLLFVIFILFISFISSLQAQAEPTSFTNPNLTLIIKADNKVIRDKESIEISADKPVQLHVGIERLSGEQKIKKDDPKLKFRIATSWNLTVDETGLVKARFLNRKMPKRGTLNEGTVVVSYGDYGDKEIGFTLVKFAVNTDSNFYASATVKTQPQNSTETGSVEVVPPAVPDMAPQEIAPTEELPDNLENLNMDNAVIIEDQEVINNDDPSAESQAIEPQEEQTEFIDYEAIKKRIKSTKKVPTLNPNLEMTDEEKRLYNEGLNQP